MKKVVVIGGGNGTAKAIRALKDRDDIELSAVVSVSDSGGSSGILRREFGALPPGDMLRAVLAMSKHDYELLKEIFYTRRFLEAGKLNNHNLGNLFLVLSGKYGGNIIHAIRALEQSVGARGKVYPVTLDKTDLIAELSNGDVVRTEGAIDRPNYGRSLRITKAWLEPEGVIFDGAKDAIESADYIIMGPGSLYCSIIAALLPGGVSEAIDRSRAKLIYAAGNAYEMIGETGPETLSECVRELQMYVPRKIDIVLYNNHVLTDANRAMYAKKQWGTIREDVEYIPEYTVVTADYERDSTDNPGLDPVKFGDILGTLIKAV